MNSLQLVSKLKVKSEDLNSNIKQILLNGTSFTLLEKELLKKQCTDLFELILKLRTEEQENLNFIAGQVPKNEEPIAEVPVVEEPISHIAQDFKTILKETSLDITLDEIVTKIEEEPIPSIVEIPSRILESAQAIVPIEYPSTTTKHEQPIEVNIEKAVENKRIQKTVLPEILEKPIVPLNESFKEREATYNDKNSKESHNPIVEKTLEAPIDNIKNAINLNKKIAFVNELFNKNVFEYAKSIDRLNQAIDLNDALRIFSDLKHQNGWTNQNELVIDLERIIKRRYAS